MRLSSCEESASSKWSERWDEPKDERGWEGATGDYELLLIEDECP